MAMKPRRRTAAFFAVALAALAALAGAGCAGSGSRLYTVAGRIVDPDTRAGIPDVRLHLSATLDGSFGARLLTAYGLTDARGNYEMSLSAEFQAMQTTDRIHLAAAKPGYAVARLDLPPPDRPRKVYPVPDLALIRNPPQLFGAPAAPAETPEPDPPDDDKPFPWR